MSYTLQLPATIIDDAKMYASSCGTKQFVMGVAAALAAVFASFGEITIRSDYPGGNVKVCGIDEANGVVRLAPDLRDTQGKWFHWDFILRGAAGRTLHFSFPSGYEYLSSLGPAISKDGGKSWAWLRPDGTRHEPANAFDYTFGPAENETRFAVSIPYSQKDWDAFMAKWRGKGVQCSVLCKSQSGTRDTELVRIPCRKDAKWLFAFTARHHACETSANPAMEGVVEAILSGTPEGEWVRDNADCVFVPFMDKDGVENGDQGKNRRPYDHNRDYLKGLYTSVRALKELLVKESEGKQIVFIDMHSPHVRGMPNSPEQDHVFTFGCRDERLAAHWNEFRRNWKETQKGGKLVYDGKYDIEGGKGYALVMEKQWAKGFMSSDPWVRTLPNCYLATCCEFGYSLCGGVYSFPAARELGSNMLKALARTVQTTAGIYDAGLYSQVPLTHVSDANRATYIADAKAAGIDGVWISVVDFFEEDVRRKPVLDHLAAEIRHFEAAGFAVGVWINAFGYGNERPFFKDSMKITTLEGKARGGAVCPLDPKLRRALIDNVRDIARAGTKFILMDDDYVQSARGLIGCSCPRHLARVAAKCGRQTVTCADVKSAFTGAPNAVRTAYLDVTGEVAVELARELRRAVDEVNPAVGMGLCASYTHWDVEGCDLQELVGAFAGRGRKVLRISGAPYWANSKLPGTGLADIIEFVRMQSAWTRGLDMTVFDENDPYPRKVARVPPWRCELYDKAIIADGHLARHKYMLCYGPDRAEPGYLEAHLANLPDDAKLRRVFAGTEPYGVKVECPQHRLRTATLPTPFAGEHYITALYSQPAAAFELRRKGIPTRFDGPASSDEPLAVTIKASPDVYQIVHCDRATGEYAVLLENMGGTAVDVQISVMGTARVVETLRGSFSVVPGGLSLAQLPPHSYAAVRFAWHGNSRSR